MIKTATEVEFSFYGIVCKQLDKVANNQAETNPILLNPSPNWVVETNHAVDRVP